MLYPQLEQGLQASKQAVNTAMSESIVKQCKERYSANTETSFTSCGDAGYKSTVRILP